ncbi:hypothetical protein HYR69_05185 [Candidatus Sumerlaeota bacterium]|nr:hypothetical protein [Candidatus Sumerlaeota bacterium]
MRRNFTSILLTKLTATLGVALIALAAFGPTYCQAMMARQYHCTPMMECSPDDEMHGMSNTSEEHSSLPDPPKSCPLQGIAKLVFAETTAKTPQIETPPSPIPAFNYAHTLLADGKKLSARDLRGSPARNSPLYLAISVLRI